MSTGRDGVPRRDVLRGVSAGSIAALAGCMGDDDESDEEGPPEPEAVAIDADTAWRTASLTDVISDEEFRIEAFDRPTLIHTFATDCAVCQSQQAQFGDLYSNADVEVVDITIDSSEDPDRVRDHADEEGHYWRFAISTDEVTGALSSDFGQEVLTSSRSPVIIDCHDGDEVYRVEKIVDAEHLESILDDVCDPSESSGSSGSSDSNDSDDSNTSSNSSA